MRTPRPWMALLLVLGACAGPIDSPLSPPGGAPPPGGHTTSPVPGAPNIDDQSSGDSAPSYPDGTPIPPPPAPAPTGPSNPLTVPYFYQYNNSISPSGTCGVTSTAMVMKLNNVQIGGKPVTPDALASRNGVSQFQSPEGISQMLQREVGFSQYTRNGTRALIRKQIDAGRPVIIHGYFTAPGHIMVVIGYDEAKQVWILNDPAGRWSGRERNGGYSTVNPTEGKGVAYPYSWFTSSIIGSDGDIWMSTAAKSSFRL